MQMRIKEVTFRHKPAWYLDSLYFNNIDKMLYKITENFHMPCHINKQSLKWVDSRNPWYKVFIIRFFNLWIDLFAAVFNYKN